MCAEVRNVAHVTLPAFATPDQRKFSPNMLHCNIFKQHLAGPPRHDDGHRPAARADGRRCILPRSQTLVTCMTCLALVYSASASSDRILAVTRPSEAHREASQRRAFRGLPPRRSRSPVRPSSSSRCRGRTSTRSTRERTLVPFASSIASASVEKRLYGDNRPEYLFLDQLILPAAPRK